MAKKNSESEAFFTKLKFSYKTKLNVNM